MDKNNFIILDGTEKTLPTFSFNASEEDFLSSNEYGMDYGGEFKSITYFIENLLLLDENNKIHKGCLGIAFRFYLDSKEITKEPLIWSNYDDCDDYLIEYWMHNLYRPDVIEETDYYDIDELNECEVKIIGWKYDI